MENKHLSPMRKVDYPILGIRPVEVLRSRLYRDEETMLMVLFLDMRNVGGKTVSEVTVDICGFDEDVNLVLTTRETYSGLAVSDNGDFGENTPIMLSSLRVRSVTATIYQVNFADGSCWARDGSTASKEKRKKPGKAERTPEEKTRTKRHWGRFLAGGIAAALLLSAGFAGVSQYLKQENQKRRQAAASIANGQYEAASEQLKDLSNDWFLGDKKSAVLWYQALLFAKNGDWQTAIQSLARQSNYPDSVNTLRQFNALLSGIVSAGERHSVALSKDGTAMAQGDNTFGQCEVSAWQNLIAVSAGWNHTLGLTTDGTVVAAGKNEKGALNVEAWAHIIGISAGENHSVGVKNNGRVVAVGDNLYGQCEVGEWSGVVAVSAGRNHTVALRQDGTALAIGDNSMHCCNVEAWTDLISISAGDGFTVGVTKDGTILTAGNSAHFGEIAQNNRITAVNGGTAHALALTQEGAAIGGGSDDWHQMQVSHWENLLALSGGVRHSIGIRSDGTAYAIGEDKDGQCRVADWRNIGLPQNAISVTALDAYLAMAATFLAE